jgi:Fe2+ or Zn2+ uptake regulation protein
VDVTKVDDRGRLDTIRDRVRARGRRWTVAKGAVLETLLDQPGHLSALQIHEVIAARLPQIDRSTVHRVLLALADEGVVHMLGHHGQTRYGMADQPHHHAVCAACGQVAEIPAHLVDLLVTQIALAVGYDLDRVTLTGRCGQCGQP